MCGAQPSMEIKRKYHFRDTHRASEHYVVFREFVHAVLYSIRWKIPHDDLPKIDKKWEEHDALLRSLSPESDYVIKYHMESCHSGKLTYLVLLITIDSLLY